MNQQNQVSLSVQQEAAAILKPFVSLALNIVAAQQNKIKSQDLIPDSLYLVHMIGSFIDDKKISHQIINDVSDIHNMFFNALSTTHIDSHPQ